MKKALFFSVAVLVVSSTFAIDSGPGGRVYMTRNSQLIGSTRYDQLYSIAFDENWAVVGSGAAQFMYHGDIIDNVTDGFRNKIVSPEVLVSGGQGYSTLGMGLHGNSSTPTPSSTTTVGDIVEIATSASSFTPTVVGDGLASATGSTWTDTGANAVPNTEKLLFAIPDVGGDFAGTGGYVLERYDYWRTLTANNDTNSDGDVTDDTNDYSGLITRDPDGHTFMHDSDYELVGEMLFRSTGYGPISNADGIWYNKYTGAGKIGTNMPWAYDGHPNVTANIDADPAFAAGIVDGHYATWVQGDGQLYMYIDYNDDGAIGAGEEVLAYHDDNVAENLNDPGTWWDIELIKNAEGTMFIVGLGSNTWEAGDVVVFVQLADNGIYSGDGVAYIAGGQDTYSNQPDYPLIWDWASMDMAEVAVAAGETPIPEPGTMLLLGTGVLGAVGYLRRRRMK